MMTVCSTEKCTGCGACAVACPLGCIGMRPSAEGFLYPEVEAERCVECGRCQSVCPSNTPMPLAKPQEVCAGWCEDSQIRRSSSSGGAFYALAADTIKRGGTVFGAILCNDMTVRHKAARTLSGIGPMMGSKYAQSELGESYDQALEFLARGREVLFTGTPCQIAGLRTLVTDDLKGNLFLVDIVCHGVPSVKFFRRYMEWLREGHPDIDPGSFRFRTLEEWNAVPNAELSGVRTPLRGRDSIYTKLFLKGYLHRESCYRCPYARPERAGDITIADFWGIGEAGRFDHDTTEGCSLAMVNTPAGAEKFRRTEGFYAESRPLSEAINGNAQLRAPVPRPPQRSGIYDYIFSHTQDEVQENFLSKKR